MEPTIVAKWGDWHIRSDLYFCSEYHKIGFSLLSIEPERLGWVIMDTAAQIPTDNHSLRDLVTALAAIYSTRNECSAAVFVERRLEKLNAKE